MFWEYAFIGVVLFALPLALLVCGLAASGGVTGLLRGVGLGLLLAGVLVIVRQVLRTRVGQLMPEFAIPVLVAAAIVYPLGAVALIRTSSTRGGRLASPRATTLLLVAASAIQLVAPWMLTSGE